MSLDTFIPDVRHPRIGGKTITIAPLKVRQIPAFARAAGPAASAVLAGDLLGAIAAHGEGMIQAVAVATGETETWLGDLDADDFLRLVGDVMEVNADFFSRRVTPALTATVTRLTAALTGPTPSPSSPAVASHSETPST